MANYYEILEIPVTASKKEIESAIDQQYTYWHRLVTHHDPSKVEEANRSLRLLEEARSVLTISAKRKKYDTELGLKSGKTAGLADPQATAPRVKLPLMNVAQNIAHQEPAQTTTDAWICGKCKTPNRIGLKFCGKCGTQIGRECIKCNKMVSTADTFCPYCGVDIAKEQARRIAEQQEKERQKEMEESACVARQREFDRQIIEQSENEKQKRKKRRIIKFLSFIAVIFISYVGVYVNYVNYLTSLRQLASTNTTRDFVQKTEITAEYLYIYFDIQESQSGAGVEPPQKASIGDGNVGIFNYLYGINNSGWNLSINTPSRKAGWVRFESKKMHPSRKYYFSYPGFDNYSIYLFETPDNIIVRFLGLVGQ